MKTIILLLFPSNLVFYAVWKFRRKTVIMKNNVINSMSITVFTHG